MILPDLHALDTDGALEEAHAGLTRAGFIVGSALGGLALVASPAEAARIPASDREVLNYALVLV